MPKYRSRHPTKRPQSLRRSPRRQTARQPTTRRRLVVESIRVPTIRVPTIISTKLKWIEKYLRRAKKQMPSLMLPRQIRSYRPPVNREMHVLGTCAVETRVITLCTHRIVVSRSGARTRRRHAVLAQRQILMTLAHELAHLRYEFHDFEQESYARTIFRAFGLKDKCPHCAGTGSIPARYLN